MSLFHRIAALKPRLGAGIIPGLGAGLRRFAELCLMTSEEARVARHNRRPAPLAGFLSERSASPSGFEGFAKRAGGRCYPNPTRWPAFLLLLGTLLGSPLAGSATTIVNTAQADFKVGALPLVTVSNQVSTTVRTPSKLDFLAYAPLAAAPESVVMAPTSYLAAGSFVTLPEPAPLGATTPLSLTNPLPLVTTTIYHEDEPIFLRLTDLDQNLNPAVAETVLVTVSLPGSSEFETLRLTETAPDTGIFTGYIQSTATGSDVPDNGVLFVAQNAAIQAHYTDAIDGTDTSAAAAMVDPYGIVFDTLSGLPVNGASVTLIDGATNLPATVYGDDGVSLFPASVTSGGTATDSSGRVYSFPPGFYRFPYLQPGRYLLKVTPPSAYRAPSTVATADLQNLPGGPYAIANPGSRGEEFLINPGPAIHIDLPVDPLRSWLHLTKAASKASVAIGDFIQYKVTVENSGSSDLGGVTVSDRIPAGFRYRTGSTRFDSRPGADPAFSGQGRTLLFALGDIGAGKSVVVTYVLEVAAGAPLGSAINSAYADGTGVTSSNIARAEVQVTEDLFSGKSLVVGRVYPRGCPGEGSDTEGVAGVRIYLEDGTYAVTDQNGHYHFEGLKPGTHLVQLDLETIPKEYELISCEENSRFAQTPFSQFVDLQGGTLWRADFYARRLPVKPPEPPVKISGSVSIELASVLNQGTEQGNSVDYTVSPAVGEVPVENLRLTVVLPAGVTYRSGSSLRDGAPLDEPEVMEGVLTYRLGNAKGGWAGKIGFKGDISAAIPAGELTTKAMLTFNTMEEKNRRTPLVDNILDNRVREIPIVAPDITVREPVVREERVAIPEITLRPLFEEFGYTLADQDKADLDRIISDLRGLVIKNILVVGHTNSTRIAPRSRDIMADNYALSKARAKSVSDYLQAGLNLEIDQMTIDGKGPDQPIASNKTFEGRALNRRVELKILAEKINRYTEQVDVRGDDVGTKVEIRHELKNIKEYSGIKAVEITALKMAEVTAEEQARKERLAVRTMPEFDGAWLDKAEPGLAFVWPYEGYYPPISSTKIAVKHDPQKKLRLMLNGQEVDPLNLDGSSKRADNKLAVTLWTGIHLDNGDNLFEAIESDADGQEVRRLTRTIHNSTAPVKAELVPSQSLLTADGKTPPVLAIRLTDKDGHPAREGLIGEYQIDSPYLPMQQLKDLQENPLLLAKSARLKYQVGEEGIARIELQPTTRTGEATLRFNLGNGDSELRAWLTGGEREWIIVGFGEGTAGYNTLAGNLENLPADRLDDEYYQDGRLAFFAKGMVRGQWLLTVAYDSAKERVGKDGSLYGTIDPRQYYTIYGDTSAQQYEAASARKLYLKIERNQFYALFGDYDTGLSVTELSRYNRNFNGLKAEMKGDNYDYTLFVSDTDQAFVKDELRGDGTSGLYRLSRTSIVANSEKITVETRDRYKSEVVLSSQTMNRYLDYDIDYDGGTLFFKSPIANRDESFNPLYIVVDYESADGADKSYNYGGRGAVRFLDKRIEVGATHVHEGRLGGEGNLYGLDSTVKLSENTRIKAEVATTSSDFKGVGADGTAYLAEISQQGKKLTGKAYLREQDGGFGLGQQMGSETGSRKIGLDTTYRWTDNLALLTTAFRQYNLATDAYRDMAELQANFAQKGYSLHGGLRHAQDNLGTGETNTSEQLITGINYNLFGDKLILRAEHDRSLGGSNSNPDFPTRTLLGADYRLTEKATIFIAEEFAEGEKERTEMTRFGLRSALWDGGQLASSLEQQATENGTRLFSVSGLKQTWQISKKWSVDGGLDRSYTIKEPGNTPINANVPAAAGTTDFTAVSGGASYREEKWSWSGRLEGRTSDTEDKYSLTTGLYGEIRAGLALGAAAQIFKTSALTGAKATTGDLRFNLASRPRDTAWIFLNRLDFLFDKQQGIDLAYDNWRLINNFNANWKRDQKTQLSLQYGAKYVSETIEADDYRGYTDLCGLEGRYDLSPKWDIGLTGKILHSWQARQMQYGSGVSTGFNVVKNGWISVGYNFTGFTDRDFSAADFTAQGPYIKFRFKFDQAGVREALQAL